MGIRSLLARRKKSKSPPNSSLKNSVFSRSGSKRTQVDELQHVFQKFDANGDGKISWSELGSIMSNLGHPASEEELQRMVREVDSDGDGFIDLNEFIELNTTGVDSSAVLEDLRNAFLIFDLDGNGSISPEELQRVLRSLGDESSMAECRKMIRGVDCDGNGLIDFEEFKIMMTRSMKMPTVIEELQ
ncbi:probable calcium-binding protein CML25 [Magnolia sinica]|uniref:probable calcium-binding protein CML25 n=1 Tax=Magnolia sinica TaxID=86752 RepID=UPI0026584B90|nr:probable calcium-binding protein CML25 [Magnolia sinica]